VVGKYILLGVLASGAHMDIIQSFHIKAGVDNWGQSDEITFNEDYVAIQVVGNPPLPGPLWP
jgi:hypothetical protein